MSCVIYNTIELLQIGQLIEKIFDIVLKLFSYNFETVEFLTVFLRQYEYSTVAHTNGNCFYVAIVIVIGIVIVII